MREGGDRGRERRRVEVQGDGGERYKGRERRRVEVQGEGGERYEERERNEKVECQQTCNVIRMYCMYLSS